MIELGKKDCGKMAGWQPIETAPKDGTLILLFTVHEADEFFEETFTAIQVGGWDEGCDDPYWCRKPGWEVNKIGNATHWMPLPEPPQ